MQWCWLVLAMMIYMWIILLNLNHAINVFHISDMPLMAYVLLHLGYSIFVKIFVNLMLR